MTKQTDLQLSYHEWTVADYHKLGEMGMLPEKRVELLAGEIIYMSPIGKSHLGTVNRLGSLLWELVKKKAVISIQNPIILDELSEPEPDIAVLRWNDTHNGDALPTSKDTLIVIEVADTTLRKDQLVKLPLYAQAAIPECWIINLKDDVLERYTIPKGDAYEMQQIYRKSDHMEHDLLGQLTIKDILL